MPKSYQILRVAFALLLMFWLSSAAASTVLTFLHTRGQDIVDEKGNKVLLRGVGLGNWLLPEGYMWKFGDNGDRPRRIEKITRDLLGEENAKRFWTEYRKNYIAEADIKRIAKLGYNSVRPALNARLFLDENGAPDDKAEGFILLDQLVAWCKANDIYVIIDMHAAPGGQTGQNIDDSANDQPELFMDAKYQDQLVALWKHIAHRYRKESAVAGYDLFNEPLPERTGAAAAYKAQVEPLYQRITAAIRQVDPKHMIIVEGVNWANDWSVFTHPFDANLVYQFHYYCWDHPVELKSIRQYLDQRNRLDAPVWVGETGESDNAIYWATTEYFEANNIGWSFWPWKKMDTQNTPYSIKSPAQWNAVAAYSRGGEKPSPETAQKAFDELLANVRLQNCVYHPEVVNAMLRRAPVRIEAENYGQAGQGVSYFVNDTNQLSRFYRKSEAVPVVPLEATRRQSGQYISLKASEWTAYTVWSSTAKNYRLTAKIQALDQPSQIQFAVGDRTFDATVSTNVWQEIELGEIPLVQGDNRIRFTVKKGVANLDWLEVK